MLKIIVQYADAHQASQETQKLVAQHVNNQRLNVDQTQNVQNHCLAST